MVHRPQFPPAKRSTTVFFKCLLNLNFMITIRLWVSWNLTFLYIMWRNDFEKALLYGSITTKPMLQFLLLQVIWLSSNFSSHRCFFNLNFFFKVVLCFNVWPEYGQLNLKIYRQNKSYKAFLLVLTCLFVFMFSIYLLWWN